MAKGVEDTAFYRYARLLALNDVGGDPSRFGIDVGRFHAGNLERAERFPLNLLTTQTHDAKRSADVRARIAALASIAGRVGSARRALARAHRRSALAAARPTTSSATSSSRRCVGAWPIEPERIEAYMEKALREAKRNTNWIEQNHDWEAAVKRFARALYSTGRSSTTSSRSSRASPMPATAARSASSCSS